MSKKDIPIVDQVQKKKEPNEQKKHKKGKEKLGKKKKMGRL